MSGSSEEGSLLDAITTGGDDVSSQPRVENQDTPGGSGRGFEARNPGFHLQLEPETTSNGHDDTASEMALVPRAAMHVDQPAAAGNLVSAAADGEQTATATVEPPIVSQKLVLEREGVRANEVVALHATEVNDGQVRAGRGQLALTKVEERRKERLEVEVTDDGHLIVSRITEVQRRTYTSIVDFMWLAASNEPLALEEDAAPEVKPTGCEKCIDICCQSCVCSFTNPFARQSRADMQQAERKKALKATEIMTPVLQRARAKGWGMFGKLTLPFVNDAARVVWIISEIVLAIVSLGLSIASFSRGNIQVFNAVHLALSILSTILAVIDGMLNLHGSCKQCFGKRQRRRDAEKGDDQPQAKTNGESKSRCGKCLDRSKSTSDFVRMILTEMILYPLLICDMFEIVTGEGYKPGESAEDVVGFVLLIVNSTLMVLYVYILRLVVLGITLQHVQRDRKPPIDDQTLAGTDYDRSIRSAGIWFQLYFFVHVFAQMVAQVFMLVAIGAKIQYDNRDYDVDKNLHASSYLWYMIVSGYFLPIGGILTFFLATYYWTQEYPIGICINLLSMLQMPDCNTIFCPGESTEEAKEKASQISRFVHYAELKKQFKDMRNKSVVGDKFAYPFRSPIIVALSIVYAAFQFAFILCAVITVNDQGEMETVVLNNNGGWVAYYIIGVILGVVANLYVFIVAAFWIAIIIGILVLVAFIIAGFIFCCIIVGCASTTSNQQRRYQ